jgi:hypothetical protein
VFSTYIYIFLVWSNHVFKGIDVTQEKNPTDVVHWNEYEALCDHLQRQILNATNPLLEGVQDVELGLKDATKTITDTQ